MIRILIADDHELVRRGLKQILLEKFSFAHIEEVTDGRQLVQKAVSQPWDIVISDIAMPEINGMEALKLIKDKVPSLPVLILSIHAGEQYASRVIKAGASGYLCKDVATNELVTAVQLILQGRKYISSNVAEKLMVALQFPHDLLLHESLSQREFEVFKMLADGKALTEIAELLCIGITTVSTYRYRVLEKMGMKSNSELTRYAIESKLL